MLKQFITPIRWTHLSPVEDGGSTIYRFEDTRGWVLIVFWDDGFTQANHIHLAVMGENWEDNPFSGPNSMSFDGENNNEIAAELNRILPRAASEPMPHNKWSLWGNDDYQRILQHLIQRVELMGNTQPE